MSAVDQLQEEHGVVAIRGTDGQIDSVRFELVDCHPQADCWPQHAPGVTAREAAERWAEREGRAVSHVRLVPRVDAWSFEAYLRDEEGDGDV